MDEYLAMRLARDRATEIEAGFRRTAYLRVPDLPDRLTAGHLIETVRRALTVRDLGRLALVSFLVMLHRHGGPGAVGWPRRGAARDRR